MDVKPLQSRRTALLFVLGSALLVYGFRIVRNYEPYTFALYDCGWQVLTVESIVEDGDLDLRNQLGNDEKGAEDQTALGKGGQWYPLHEPLMPLFTVPLYLLSGPNGCLIFNYLQSSLLLVAMYALARRKTRPWLAALSTLAVAFTSNLIDYSYSYSLDVFGALLLLLAVFQLVEGRIYLSGFLWGLAVLGRNANVVTLFGFIYYISTRAESSEFSGTSIRSAASRLSSLCAFLSGGILPAAVFFASNWSMFGNPFATAYAHWQVYSNGSLKLANQMGLFGAPLLKGLAFNLWDGKSGFFTGAPLAFPALLPGLPVMFYRERREAILLSICSLSLLVLFSAYERGFPGAGGNRYLISLTAFLAIPFAHLLESLLLFLSVSVHERGNNPLRWFSVHETDD